MSGPGAAPPGYYPDPDGAPGMVRWWDGGGWSDVLTPAGPGVSTGRGETAHRPAPSPWQPAVPVRGHGRTPWVVGAVVTAVVVLVVAVVVGTTGRGTSNPSPTVVAVPTGPTFAPGTVQIVDEDAGIAYPYLGDGWYQYALGAPLETTSVQGQYFITQDTVPDGGEFIAQITSGPVAEGYGWSGAGSEQATIETLAESVRANYYPGPNEREVLRDEATTVDGAPAWVYEFVLSWDTAGYDATGERAALVVIDTGRAAPALLYLSIPNTHAELYGVIDRVIGAVDVL
ncbi:Protein of unknown function [Klenkia soli]|uniref:DUF2510 domain-containing protein n=1 Tax=Klenkia soli TaxID=1052260 RepID=A0A1H0HEK6_9ACTN|nr:DUF2510 domain-containing protein [Klenkia soli]SDO17474.1 Protein of unknown function [Klenkia soli]